MKVVDTTFLIDVLKGEPGAVAKARELDDEGSAATTAVNVYEVAYGVYRRRTDATRRMEALGRLLSNLDVLPLNEASALRAAQISGTLDRNGERIDPFDALIAGIVIESGADSLVTKNLTHFKRVKDIKVETH